MKVQELRNLTSKELEEKLLDLKKSLLELNYQRKTQTLQKPHLIRATRKDIARVLTILKERNEAEKKSS